MRSVVKAGIIGAILAVGTLALVIVAMLRSFEYHCEVCVQFEGNTVCREAKGSSAEEAMRTAQDNACAFVASGMTQIVQCTAKPPTRASCAEP